MAQTLSKSNRALTFQQVIMALQNFWQDQGCVVWLPYHEMVGAGTGNTATALRVLGPEPWNVAYVEPSFRADDGRFAENPNRVQMHHQFQVILKPSPLNPQELYIKSLEAIGVDLTQHDIRFVEDNWASPALGAWGLGWEVWLDGMEVSQFTYFQSAGGKPLDPVATELTYGLERLVMYLQGVDSLWDIRWNDTLSYGDILKRQEVEFCEYNFNLADTEALKSAYNLYRAEAQSCLKKKLVVPAHDFVLKCSNIFNILDARGGIGLAERVKYFGEMRALSRSVAETFVAQREEAGFPFAKQLAERVLPQPEISKAAEKGPQTLVFEILTEELAADVPEQMLTQLKELLAAAFAESRLAHAEMRFLATPRRLVAVIEKVADGTLERTVEVKGPREDVCQKNPKALEGFCKKNNITADQVKYVAVDGVKHASASIVEPGRSATTILTEILAGVLAKLKAEQSMRWLSSAEFPRDASVAFNRPIRSLLALLGSSVVPVRYAGLVGGRTTVGGRWSGSPIISVPTAAAYESMMREAGVTLAAAERKKDLIAQLQKIASQKNLTVGMPESLLDEVSYLVEQPVVFLGTVPEQYHSLPAVVTTGVMQKHLRFFPLSSKDGTVVAFLAASNGMRNAEKTIVAGYERVLHARLADARFFIDRDAESKLADFRERIKTLTFVEKLGSMFDKTERIAQLMARITESVQAFSVPKPLLTRTAELSKADLGSHMVTEITSLQGEMGALYALRDGEDPVIATAIREQYMPAGPTSELPRSTLGRLLGLADRLDTLIALFSVGAEPTGSADPYGLRREALGILRIVLASSVDVNLRDLLRSAAAVLKLSDPEKSVSSAAAFLTKRLEVLLRDEGVRYDLVRAVLARLGDEPNKARATMRIIETFLTQSDAPATFEVVLRCVRVLRHAAEKSAAVAPTLDPSKLTEPTERALIAALQKSGSETSLAVSLEQMKSLAPAIHAFFESVMVMAPDAVLRGQRLKLVSTLLGSIEQHADLTLLEGLIK